MSLAHFMTYEIASVRRQGRARRSLAELVKPKRERTTDPFKIASSVWAVGWAMGWRLVVQGVVAVVVAIGRQLLFSSTL